MTSMGGDDGRKKPKAGGKMGHESRCRKALAGALAGFVLMGLSLPAGANPQRAPQPLGGLLSEVRLGFGYHDAGVFGRHKEGGEDYNLELVFVSPQFLEFLWSPRPHIGVSINNAGHASQAYGGLTWGWEFWEYFFFNATFGLSGHNGETVSDRLDDKELGSYILFRESLELGVRVYGGDGFSIMLDHSSHGTFFNDENEGIDTLLLRYSYRF